MTRRAKAIADMSDEELVAETDDALFSALIESQHALHRIIMEIERRRSARWQRYVERQSVVFMNPRRVERADEIPAFMRRTGGEG